MKHGTPGIPENGKMRSVAMTMAAAVCLAFAGVAQAALVNPSFDDGPAGTTTPPIIGWSDFGNTGNIFREAGGLPTHSGSHHVKMFSQFTGSFNVTGVFQDLAASPGQLWEASVWVKHNTGDALGGANAALLKIEFKDAGFASLGPDVELTILTAGDPLDTYTFHSVTHLAPATAAWARVVLLFLGDQANSGGAAFFDDASFNVIPTPSSAAMLVAVGAAAALRRRTRNSELGTRD